MVRSPGSPKSSGVSASSINCIVRLIAHSEPGPVCCGGSTSCFVFVAVGIVCLSKMGVVVFELPCVRFGDHRLTQRGVFFEYGARGLLMRQTRVLSFLGGDFSLNFFFGRHCGSPFDSGWGNKSRLRVPC